MKNDILNSKYIYLIPIILLLIISLFDMYGAGNISPLYQNVLPRQAMWILVSLAVSGVLLGMDFRLFYRWAYFFYALGIILLVMVLFMGKTINGASSWFKIGPFSIQPSEIFKFFYIIALAKLIDRHRKGSFTLLVKIAILSLLPCGLIFLEPDTGVVVMFLLITIGEIMASQIKKWQLGLVASFGLIMLGSLFYLYFCEKDLFVSIFGTSFFYRMDRLLSFKDKSSYQLTNALIGIGASGKNGFGLLSSKIYVPEITTDFVFDLTILNFGYVMGIGVILLYSFLLFLLARDIYSSKKRYNKCILSGILGLMLFQVFEHIMMNIGLTPITGITLPFLSYGGSSLLSYSMLFVLVIKLKSPNYNKKKSKKDFKRKYYRLNSSSYN